MPDVFDTPEAKIKERELTYGEKAVGLKFNPGKSTDVDRIKKQYAWLIDFHNEAIAEEQNQEHPDGEVIRLHKVAITELQGTQMWSVKAATWERNQ